MVLGNADGLGHVRQKELKRSALHLGLRSEADVYIVDDPLLFPDSMTTTWSEKDISSLLATTFLPGSAESSKSSMKKKTKTPASSTATIDILLTFDRYGISNHPNHRSLYHGAIYLLKTLMMERKSSSSPVALYTLTTTNIVRKYLGVLDAPTTMLVGAVSRIFSGSLSSSSSSSRDSPQRLLFVSSVQEWLTAQSAMVKGHQSQMVWFRWGWITLGRYMVVNDLKREM